MTGIFLMVFEVTLKSWPKIFFSTANRISYANKHFSEKNFCMQNLIFCEHNVVLDTIKVALISFHLHFFSKTLKIPIFLYGVLMYALINV